MDNSFCFVFDLDGTVTACETLPLIGRHFKIEKEISALTQSAIAGDVPYLENFIHRIRLLSGYPVEEISLLLENVPLHPVLTDFISLHASRCRIATTNLDLWIDKLAKRIPCQVHCSRAVQKNGCIDKLEMVLKKDQLVKDLQDAGKKVAFIGEGHNDMEAMRLADVAIACGLTHEPARSLMPVADYVCYEENTLCRLLQQLC